MPVFRDWRKSWSLTDKNTWTNSRRLIWRNDKDYLPAILRKIVASASRDSGQNIAGDFHEENTNPDPVATAFNKTRRIDRVREMRAGYTEKSASVESAPRIDAGPEKDCASRPP